MKGYGARVDALLDRLGGDLTQQDFADLAMACLDQAELPVRQQLQVARILDEKVGTDCSGSLAALGVAS